MFTLNSSGKLGVWVETGNPESPFEYSESFRTAGGNGHVETYRAKIHILDDARLILVCCPDRTTLYEARDPTPKDDSTYRMACEIGRGTDYTEPMDLCVLPGHRVCGSVIHNRSQSYNHLSRTDLVVYQLPPPPPSTAATGSFTADIALFDSLKLRTSSDDSGKSDTPNRSWAVSVQPRNRVRAFVQSVAEASPLAALRPTPLSDAIPALWRAPLAKSAPLYAHALLALPPPYEHVILCTNGARGLLLFDTKTMRDCGTGPDPGPAVYSNPSLVWYSISDAFSETTGPIFLWNLGDRFEVWQIVLSASDGGGVPVLVLKPRGVKIKPGVYKAACVVLSDKRIVLSDDSQTSVYMFDRNSNQINVLNQNLLPRLKAGERAPRNHSLTVLPNDDIITCEHRVPVR